MDKIRIRTTFRHALIGSVSLALLGVPFVTVGAKDKKDKDDSNQSSGKDTGKSSTPDTRRDTGRSSNRDTPPTPSTSRDNGAERGMSPHNDRSYPPATNNNSHSTPAPEPSRDRKIENPKPPKPIEPKRTAPTPPRNTLPTPVPPLPIHPNSPVVVTPKPYKPTPSPVTPTPVPLPTQVPKISLPVTPTLVPQPTKTPITLPGVVPTPIKQLKLPTPTPLPGKTPQPPGSPKVVKTANPQLPNHTVITHTGVKVTLNSRGHVLRLVKNGMTIMHSPVSAMRLVKIERPGGARIVLQQFKDHYTGYVRHPFRFHDRDFATRTYIRSYKRGGMGYYDHYVRYYASYNYHGRQDIVLDRYITHYYYAPAFYSWAGQSWAASVPYSWSWASDPWYANYGYYFRPYPAYASPYAWLTDYILAASLQEAYAQQANQNAAATASTEGGLSSEVKQQIETEVRQQLAQENSERASAVPAANAPDAGSDLADILAHVSSDQPYLFVVTSALDATATDNNVIELTPGDVLRLSTPPAPDANTADLEIFASKTSDAQGAMVTVGLNDLQEMLNQMRASIDQGLQDLKQQPRGLPPLPADAASPPQAASIALTAPTEPGAVKELQFEEREADLTDQQAQGEVAAEQSTTEQPEIVVTPPVVIPPVENPTTETPPVETTSTAPPVNDALTSGPPTSPAVPAAQPAGAPGQLNILGQTISKVEALLGKPDNILMVGTKQIYVYQVLGLRVTFLDGKAIAAQ